MKVTQSRQNYLRGINSATAIAAALTITGPSLTFAQDGDTAQPRTGLDTITVTARKKEENLQTTPVAVTALGADTLDERQITNVEGVQYNAPNILILPTTGGSAIPIAIRGQVGSENTAANDQAVGVYIDGVYAARSSIGFLELVDVERVEVLRGPQGTLFGRNTTGGAINIVTPTPDGEFSGRVTGRYGNFNAWDVLGHVNVPIMGDEVAARVSFKHGERDGYGESLTTGLDFNDANTDYVRGVLRIAPENSIFDVTLAGDYFNRQGNGVLAALDFVQPGSTADTFFGFSNFISPEFQTNFSQLDSFEDITAKGASATINIDLGGVQLKSISAARYTENNVNTDADGSPLPIIEFEQNNEQEQQYSQELQLSGSTERFDWILGGYFFTENNDDATRSTTADTFGQIDNQSVAIFGQATYSLTDRLRFTGGLRYTWDDRETVISLLTPGSTACTIPVVQLDDPAGCTVTRSADFSYLSYLANIDYQLNDNVFAYVKTSRGNRSGGFNHRQILPAYNPEQVTDYEIGLKTDLFDNRLRANLALFYSDYKDVQRTVVTVINGAPSAVVSNAAEAEIFGAELEVSALPTDNLEIGGSLGLLDPSYKTFDDPLLGDRSGEPFAYAPDTTYSLYANYTIPLSIGDAKLHADWGYRSRVFYETRTGNQGSQAGYGVLNLRGSLGIGENVELAMFAKNVNNAEYNTFVLDVVSAFGYTLGYRGYPRTWGGEITVRF